ncbi:hypothetical protein ACT3UA_11350 [Glutamicibacter sp. 363]|uniref:hypothetical protein n=1 Tax=unclassified Glutamicibacter TaxID=2627139 RepID=UPI004034AE70
MTTIPVQNVHTSKEARDELGSLLATFRKEGSKASPLVFGSHRKPEAVVLPFEVFEQIAPALEDLEIAHIVNSRCDDKIIPLSEIAEQFGLDPEQYV